MTAARARAPLRARRAASWLAAWRLEGDVAFPIQNARLACKLARAAALAAYQTRFGRLWPDDVHHAVGGRDSGFWSALDTDDDGALDLMIYRVDQGVGEDVRDVMRTPLTLFLPHGPAWRLAPVPAEGRALDPLLGPARIWASMTPYVTPRDCFDNATRQAKRRYRNGRAPIEQVLAELAELDAPPAEAQFVPARLCAGGRLEAEDFRAEDDLASDARAHTRAPRFAEWGFLQIVFAAPVEALPPLGFAAHGGLGLLLPTA